MSQSKVQNGTPNRYTRFTGRAAGVFTASLILTLTGLVTGCGSHTVITDPNPMPTYTTWPLPIPSPWPSPNPSPTPSGNLLPPITTSFSVTGPEGTTPSFSTTVDTDDILRIKITSDSAGKVSLPGYGFYAEYDCVKYTIQVMGDTITTNVLSVNNGNQGGYPAPWGCYGAPTSQVVDVSARLSPGHGPVKITVKAEGYDFYCKLCESQTPYNYWPNSCATYCPMRGVYKTHTVKGKLDIQVNGTSL
jgi:hypothetical protein